MNSPKGKIINQAIIVFMKVQQGYALGGFVLNILEKIVVFGGLIVGLKYFADINVPPKMIPLFGIALFIGFYLLGDFDWKSGFWQKRSSLQSKELNPFFEEMDKKLNKLLEK